MHPFLYRRADSLGLAVHTASSAAKQATPANAAPVQLISGGTTILDLMKLDVMRPDMLVDVSGLATEYGRIAADADGLRLGAFALMSQAAEHALVVRDYPVVADTLKLAASAQIRNMATLGGNVLQRTRCEYFRDTAWSQCNKRLPGSGCAALNGINRKHAILGVSDACIASYPGDFAQALVALGAQVQTVGVGGTRRFPFEQLHLNPNTPERETVLAPGEIITAFLIPAGSWTRRSTYVKVRDRESYEFAVASAAVALDLDGGGTVREARVGLGGVAYKPWRSREAEASLKGKVFGMETAEQAARAAFAGAKPREHNRYKVELGQRTLVRALLQASRMSIA